MEHQIIDIRHYVRDIAGSDIPADIKEYGATEAFRMWECKLSRLGIDSASDTTALTDGILETLKRVEKEDIAI